MQNVSITKLIENNMSAMNCCSKIAHSILLIFIILLGVVSCKSTNNKTEYKVNGSSELVSYADQIAFLMFTIEKDTLKNKNIVQLKDMKFASGTMRDDNSDKIKSAYFLTVEVYENSLLSRTFYVEHPLYKKAEFSTSDGKLTTKTVELDKSDFFIRIQVKSQQTEIIISETLSDEIKNELIILKI